MNAALPTSRQAAHTPLALEVLLALCAGALHSLPFVFTDMWALQIAFVALLVWRVGDAPPARAAMLGFAFGSAWLLAGTWWLYISMHRYGGLPAGLAALAVAVLAAFLSLYLAAALALYARWRSGAPLADALLFAACWLLAELARGVLFTGFPWLASGYAHVDGPLAALAPWVGVYGMGAAAAGLGALLGTVAWAFQVPPSRMARRKNAIVVALAVLLVVALARIGPGDHTRPSATLQVSLLQTNVPQDQKFVAAQMPQTLDWLAAALRAAPVDLVIAPETAIPLLPDDLPADYWRPLKAYFERGDRAALIGLPLGSYERGYTNSVAGLSSAAAASSQSYYRYDKHHLVPFGEFIPRGFRWFTDLMNIPLGDFNRGPLVAPSFVVRGERVAPNICYEDLFGEELGARFRDADSAPTMFANLSNIGWFGDTIAVEQHLNISRLRTLEFQRPMLRATNTGATAIIDHRGRVTVSLAPQTRGHVEGPAQGRSGLTPYARWVSRWSLWPLLAAAVFVVAVMGLRVALQRVRRLPP